jgi:hypothetical protein
MNVPAGTFLAATAMLSSAWRNTTGLERDATAGIAGNPISKTRD